MNTISPINFELPDSLIATSPLKNRDHSRLMMLNRTSNTINHHRFSDIINVLTPNDVLVLNDTKVIKARLFAYRQSGGRVEILLNQPLKKNTWSVLIKPAKRIRVGETLQFDANNTVKIIEKTPEYAIASFSINQPFLKFVDQTGHTPLPPYIQSKIPQNQANQLFSNYQTHYAKKAGAVAAPTAGLHFTPELLLALKKKGIQIETITLHIGLGTFQPLQSTDVTKIQLHEESFYIEPTTAKRLTHAIQNPSQRIVAIGTTTVRTIESAYINNQMQAGHGKTRLFIYPGYVFKGVDALITNFHLPNSSLLHLVNAFASTKLTTTAYQIAIKKNYRFYSFGDAMLIQ